MKRIIVFVLILAIFSVGALAGDEAVKDGEEYMESVGSAVPDDARELLPEGTLDGSLSVGNIGVGTFFGMIVRALKGAAPKAAKNFALATALSVPLSAVSAMAALVRARYSAY